MARIVNNRICYPTHNVVWEYELYRNDVAFGIDYLQQMAKELSPNARPAVHKKELTAISNDGSWTIELPVVTLVPFYESERAERVGRTVPQQILATVTKHDGEYYKVCFVGHCARNESFQPLWSRMYQQGLKIGKAQRRVAEAQYFVQYDREVTRVAALAYEDPACCI